MTPQTPQPTARRVRTTAVSLAMAAVLSAGSLATAAPAFAKPDHAGKGGPAAVAEQPVKGGKPDHVKGGKPDHVVKGGKSDVAKAERKFTKRIEQLDRRLAGAVSDSRLAGLTEADIAAVLANVEADRAELVALAESVAALTGAGDVRAAAKALKDFRVQQYVVVVNFLRQAAELAVEVADAEAAGVDVTEVQALLDDAVAALHLVTAQSDRSELRDAKSVLEDARELLEELVEAAEEPVVEEPTTDPTTDPTTEPTTDPVV